MPTVDASVMSPKGSPGRGSTSTGAETSAAFSCWKAVSCASSHSNAASVPVSRVSGSAISAKRSTKRR